MIYESYDAYCAAKKPFIDRLDAAREALKQARANGESAYEKEQKKKEEAEREAVYYKLLGELNEVKREIARLKDFPSMSLQKKYFDFKCQVEIANLRRYKSSFRSRIDIAGEEYDVAYQELSEFVSNNGF